MTVQHKELAAGRWAKLSFMEQMANVGSEVGRAISWKEKGDDEYSRSAFVRALELLDLTIDDQKKPARLKELTRVREALADYFVFKNEYHSTSDSWNRYFLAFNYAARIGI